MGWFILTRAIVYGISFDLITVLTLSPEPLAPTTTLEIQGNIRYSSIVAVAKELLGLAITTQTKGLVASFENVTVILEFQTR